MFLHDDKFITAEASEKTVFGQNTGQAGRKDLDEEITFLVSIIVVYPFQSVQIEHHHADIQCIAALLQLQQMLFECFLIVYTGYIGERLDRYIIDIPVQC